MSQDNEDGAHATETISIIGKEDEDTRSKMIKLSDYLYDQNDVPVDTLQERFHKFLVSMQKVVKNAPDDFGEFKLDSVSLTAEVSAKGSISLIGGAELGGKGGITITLKKPS